MKLSVIQAINVIKNPTHKEEINKGKEYESTLRIFTEEKFKTDLEKELAWRNFNSFLSKILSKKKFVRIQDFIKYPLPVVNIGKGVLKDIYKVFDSQNSYFHVEFLNKIGKETVKQMLSNINVHQWIVSKGKQVLKNKPNSIVVVDRDSSGNPYLVFVESSRLIDLKVNQDSSLGYIAFTHSKFKNESGQIIEYISVYDDEYYRIFQKINGSEPMLVEGMEFPHNIGYCPARMFMSETLNNDDDYNRQIPLSPVLSKLQELQQFEIYKYYTDHYGAFPIVEKPSEKCNVDGCSNGVIYLDEEDSEGNVYKKTHRCEACDNRNIIGPGTVLDIDVKQDKDDVDSSGVLRFINPDIKNNEYLGKHIQELETWINLKTVGENEILKVQAINEDQVAGSFEAKKTILINWKIQFDELYKWITETLVKSLEVNSEVVVHSNFGTEFYLMTEDDIQLRYNNAVKFGLPITEVDMIYNQLIETKYKGNPDVLERMKLIRTLDPDPYSNPDKSLIKKQNGMISNNDLIIKSNLLRFVERFELENGSIVEFGKNIDLSKKVDTINKEFLKYIKDGQFENETEQV